VHRFHVPALAAADGQVTLPRGEAHHLVRVLRLSEGTEVILFDGRGHEWLGRVAEAGRVTVRVDVITPRPATPEPPVPVTLAVGVLKGDQMDHAVREATMAGAVAIAPFVSAHVAVAERAWRARSIERWERVAVASAKQCARAVVPTIAPVVRLEELLAGWRDGLRLLSVEPAHAGISNHATPVPRPGRALVLVGPEGGWTAAELDVARQQGCQLTSFGPRTLRAEIAPAVILSVLWTWWGWT